jgi:hypothetical protein
MLDASELRKALEFSESGLSLIVSDDVYGNVLRRRSSDVYPAVYSKVTMQLKQTEAHAWVLQEADAG